MKITGEYWIINGRADFADANRSDKSHEMIAIEHICSEHLEKIYNYAKTIESNIPSLSSLEDEPTESVQSLLGLILRKLFTMTEPNNPGRPLYKSDVEIWREIEKQCNLDDEALHVMMNNDQNLYRYSRQVSTNDPRLYVMKKEGWIAVRNNNIELYGLDPNKLKELASGVDDIIDQETGWAGNESEEINDEDVEFNLFDHKNNKSIDITLKDIKERSVLRPQRIPQTTYNRSLPIIQGKQHGRELWRGTSESFSFKEWLNQIDSFILENINKMILYHGSYAKINAFKIQEFSPRTDWGYFGLGVYLTPNPLLARHYGPNIHECEVNLNNPLIWSKSKEELYEKYPNDYETGTREWAEKLTKSIKSDGYDGVIKIQPGLGMGMNRVSEVCVFDPENIKVLDSMWNLEGAEKVVGELRRAKPFFSKDQYDSFVNNWR